MEQLVSGMAAITETTISERGSRISVADTLDHARRALSAHREWLQGRLQADDGVEAETASNTTDATREHWKVTDVEEDEEDEELEPHEQPRTTAPPTFMGQWEKKKNSCRVAPAPFLEVLAEEEEKDISAGLAWATGSRELCNGESKEKKPGEESPQEPPSSKRPKTRWASRAAVFPASSEPSSDTGSTPFHLFTSTPTTTAPAAPPEPLFSPSLTLHNPLAAWGSLSSLDNYMESLDPAKPAREQGAEQMQTAALQVSTSTESSLATQESNTANSCVSEGQNPNSDSLPLVPNERAKEMGGAQNTAEILETSSPDEADPVEQENDRAEMVDISVLQSESTATILAVGPAPRDKQSSYEIHQVTKLEEAGRGVRLVELRERSPAELESVSDLRITPGHRAAAKPPTVSETGVVEDVLPYQKEDSESPGGATGPGAQQTTKSDSVLSDDEVFEPQPAEPLLTQPQRVAESENKALSTRDPSNTNENTKIKHSSTASISDTAEKVKVPERKGEGSILQANGGDLSFQPRVTSTPAAGGTLEGERVGEGGTDNRKLILEKLKLPPLKENRSSSILSLLPRLKSHTPSSPTNTGISTVLKLSRKRSQELPSYSTHHCRLSGLALSPPCPLYGTRQPDITPDSFQRKRLSSAPAAQPSPSPSPSSPSDQIDGWSRTPSPHDFKSLPSPTMGQGHPPLRQTMSTPEGDGGREGIRRVSSVPESPLTKSQGVGSLDASGARGSTTSLYQMQTGPGPLHLAAKCGNGRQLQQLISLGENVNARDHDGRTPLMYCIHPRGVHLACASLLVQAGAALDKQASDGSTAIHLAAAVGGVALIEFALLNHADPDVRDFEGRLPLHWTTMSRQSSKCAALLLKHSKLDVNAMDDAGMTPLMWAAYNNNSLVTEFLLGQGADCEEKDRDGMTAMHWAVHQEGVRCLELLLKADHTYFKDHRGRTVLHLSAEVGSLAACDIIIRLRGDAVHDLDRMGRTPLHYAAACSRVDVCAFLLDRGSDAAHRDLTGKTAIEYARLKRFDYVVALLTCHGTAVADFARTSRSTSVSSLLSRAKSFSDLPTCGDAPGNNDIITESLQPMSASEGSEVTEADISVLYEGAFLGRFVPDKNDPVQHFFFWVDTRGSKLHWSRKRDSRRAQEATVYRVARGPSKRLEKNPAYSASELYQHVFWVETDCGVLDLLAYNDTSYQNWVEGLGKMAQGTPPKTTPEKGGSGAENRETETLVPLRRRREAKSALLKGKRSVAVAPALVIENESVSGLREGWSESSQPTGDSEVELQTLPDMETTNQPTSQGSPPHGIDDII